MARRRKAANGGMEAVVDGSNVTPFLVGLDADISEDYQSKHTGEEIDEATEKAHGHGNKAVLDKFGESGGQPTFAGNPIIGTGGSESVELSANDTPAPGTRIHLRIHKKITNWLGFPTPPAVPVAGSLMLPDGQTVDGAVQLSNGEIHPLFLLEKSGG